MAEFYPAGIRAAALALRCPRCGSDPGVACVDRAGRFIPALHSGRKTDAVGRVRMEPRPRSRAS